MANNNILYNAAVAGFLQGAISGRYIVDSVQADYAAVVNAAQAFALKVDSLIANDPTISQGGGPVINITGGSNAQAAPLLAKVELLKSLCAGAMQGRYSVDTVQADYQQVAAAVAAVYAQALTVLTIP